MEDLVGWLRAQLDEDERLAQSAGGSSWRWAHGYGEMCNDDACPFGQLLADTAPHPTVLMNVHGYDVEDPWQGAGHIARHDPARVLAEVDAKRRMLPHIDDVRGDEDRIDGEWGMGNWATDDPDRASVQLLRLLALPYADRPGYREEWRP